MRHDQRPKTRSSCSFLKHPVEQEPIVVPPTFDQQGATPKKTESLQLVSHFNQRRPIRITCPGEMRREKGFADYMQPLVDELWDSHLANQRVQFVAQRPKHKLFQRRKLDIQLPDPEINAFDFQPHPLPEADYVELIKSSDAGLLFYDSRVYFSRRAGVLGELLSCGKPVIVPAGSWLASQIQPLIENYIQDTKKRNPEVRRLQLEKLSWSQTNVPLSGGVFSFDESRHPFEVSWERDADEQMVIVEFEWHWPDSQGVFCRLDLNQSARNDNESMKTLSVDSQVRGQSTGSRISRVLFRVHPDCDVFQLKFTHVFHDSNLTLKNLRILSFASDSSAVPLGAVGVVVSDQQQLACGVKELVEHFEHYPANRQEPLEVFLSQSCSATNCGSIARQIRC